MKWIIKNHVFANLLMIFFILIGLTNIFTIKKEVMPEFDLDYITITVPYRGATPKDVEQSICIKIEEKIAGIEGIKKISSTSVEGYGTVFVELKSDADKIQVYNDIKNAVDQITTFPEEADKPIIKFLENKKQVLNIVVSGNEDLLTLTRIAEKIKDKISALKDVSLVDLTGTKPYQIKINIKPAILRKYNLTLSAISDKIKKNILDIPGGIIKTYNNEILIRTIGKRYNRRQFEDLPIITGIDGTYIKLGDIAKIEDSFEDIDLYSEFDSKPAVYIRVWREGDQSVLDISKEVKNFIKEIEPELPEGIKLSIWQDDTKFLKDRINLLLKNAKYGFLLVLISLALFLDLRLAFWVCTGMAVAFLGSFLILPHFNVSINMISLFAFIICLGIVVDDAIVIGEQIFQEIENGKPPEDAAIYGTLKMYKPVFFSVSTTLAAFYPLLIITGIIGKFLVTIPKVVFAVLAISYLESVIILPVHLSSIKIKKSWYSFVSEKSAKLLEAFVNKVYLRFLEHVLEWRYLYLAFSISLLIITAGYYFSGRLKFTFFPKVESDIIVASLTMNEGTPFNETLKTAKFIEKKAYKLKDLFLQDNISVIKHINLIVGTQPFTKIMKHGGVQIGSPQSGANLAEVVIELISSENRKYSAKEIANKWRELVGIIPGAKSLIFSSSLFSAGNAIEINLISDNYNDLKIASRELKSELKQYPGVFDVRDTFYEGKNEIKIRLKPYAYILGFSTYSIGREIRAAFYGDESVRINRNKDDLRIMVKYPEDITKTLYTLQNMRFLSIPFSDLVNIEIVKTSSVINREDRKRVVKVMADVNENIISPDKIIADLKDKFLPQLKSKFLGLEYSFQGERKEEITTLRELKIGTFIALFIIYALLAIPFKSYFQPFIIMIVIPFGVVGAIIGHIMLGYSLSLLSLLGIVALSGVVVNDSLIMVYSINQQKNINLHAKILNVAKTRFRPVILTTITTFLGLLPLILEKSLQAKFLIPMAISLGFGILFATIITLIIIPILYYIFEDISNLIIN